MSRPRPPRPAKLVIGLLMRERSELPAVAQSLSAVFGALELVSDWMDFDFTEYYAAEMGTPLYRRMLVFRDLVAQDALPAIKLQTNRVEARFSTGSARRINIDPGILTPERFVLATGKNFTHRVYLADGIYADLTLIFTRGAFENLPWTYPDYRSTGMHGFLMQVRERYLNPVRHNP